MTTKAASAARERILATADDLFYHQGVRAVGVDTIIEKSGVAKMTLYRHFPSKDDLVAAHLEQRDRIYWQWFEQAVGRHPGDPRAQLLDLFDALHEEVCRPDFRGCPFLNSTVEFPGPDSASIRIAAAHRRDVVARVRALAEQLGAREPEQLAEQLTVLMTGVRVSVKSYATVGAAIAAKSAAATLIDAQLAVHAQPA